MEFYLEIIISAVVFIIVGLIVMRELVQQGRV